MQKITYLINSLSAGGAEKVLSVIVTELIRQKYRVEVIFLERNEFYELPKEVEKTYLSDSNGTESSMKKLVYIPLLAFRLRNHIQKNDILLIQSHVFRANYINVLAKLFGSTHQAQIVTAGRISRYKELGFKGKINLLLIKYLYPHADLVISKAKGMEDDMQRLFHFTNEQIVINNPYDIKQIEQLSREKVTDFVFDNTKRYLISVGRLVPLKRNHELIDSLNNLPKNIELIFLGDGKEKVNLLSLSEKLNLKNRVHFLGQVQNPYKYLSKSDIFVSCSESEGFPNALVEAMICGIPVISSDCISGPREILAPNSDISKQLKFDDFIEKAEYGVLYPIGNIDRLVESIKSLLDNNELRRYYIKRSKERSNEFSVEKNVEKYKKILLNE